MKSAFKDHWDAQKRSKLNYYCGTLSENIGDPQTTWKELKDLIGKKSAATEIDDILTGSRVTLNSAQEVANHFDLQFTQRGPNLTSNLRTSSISAEDY